MNTLRNDRDHRRRAATAGGTSPSQARDDGRCGGRESKASLVRESNRCLQIATRRLGASICIDVRGELDIATAPRLYNAARRLAPAAELLIIDLTRLSFIDSTGLGTLDRIYREVTRRLRILPGPTPNKLFAITNAQTFLPIVRAGEGNAPQAEG